MALSELDSKSLRRAAQYRERHLNRLRNIDPCDDAESDTDHTENPYDPAPVHTEYKQEQSSLTEDEIKQVVIRYGFGASTYELAADYGVHRGTISRALKQSGIDVTADMARREALTERIIEMYADFMRPVDIGKEVGLHQATVLKILHSNGVRIRSSSEYKKCTR